MADEEREISQSRSGREWRAHESSERESLQDEVRDSSEDRALGQVASTDAEVMRDLGPVAERMYKLALKLKLKGNNFANLVAQGAQTDAENNRRAREEERKERKGSRGREERERKG